MAGVLQSRARRRRRQFDAAGVAAGNVDVVKAFIGEHPDRAAVVLEAERAGKARSTLMAWLEVAAVSHGINTWDPADGTVDDVIAFVTDQPDQLDRIREAEVDGEQRSTLLAYLDRSIEARDTEVPPGGSGGDAGGEEGDTSGGSQTTTDGGTGEPTPG